MADSIEIKIELTDNFNMTAEEFENACYRALTKCGLTAENYASLLCIVDTGNLRNSITSTVDRSQKTAHIGTNVEYAPYVELGTGKYYPGGRPTPWVYQDARGNWHMTHGQKAHPFLKPAIADHAAEYQEIIRRELQGG